MPPWPHGERTSFSEFAKQRERTIDGQAGRGVRAAKHRKEQRFFPKNQGRSFHLATASRNTASAGKSSQPLKEQLFLQVFLAIIVRLQLRTFGQTFPCLQTSTGQQLGVVPPDKYSHIPKQACTGSIRSIRRAPQGGEVHQVLVRIDSQLSGTRYLISSQPQSSAHDLNGDTHACASTTGASVPRQLW